MKVIEGELKISNENNQNVQEEFDQVKDVNEQLKRQIQTLSANQTDKKKLSEDSNMGRILDKYYYYIIPNLNKNNFFFFRENIKPKHPEKLKEKKTINLSELEILKDLLLYKILRGSCLSQLENSILNSNTSKELSSNDLKDILEKYFDKYF